MAEPKTPPFAALRAFHAAAVHGRFKDTAERLGVTESAISHQVRRLEDFLHTPLLDRPGTGSGARGAADRGGAALSGADAAAEAPRSGVRQVERWLHGLAAPPVT